MNATGWVILGIANVPVYFGLGWVFFKDREDFYECIRFWLTPDLISLFRGECVDDWLAELRLGLWVSVCAGCLYGEAWVIGMVLG